MALSVPNPGYRRVSTIANRLLATIVASIFVLPLLWALSASLRERGVQAPRSIDWLPSPVAWENYEAIFRVVALQRYMLNSLVVAGLAVPTTVVVASLAGFSISQLPPRWRMRLMVFSVCCLMVPLTAIWLPRFILFKEAGLMNNLFALVVPSLMGTSPFYVLLFIWTFLRIPREVYDAARIDGAGPFRMWGQIGLPVARPAVISVAVLSFVHYWNSFVEPLLLIRTDDKATASLGLRVLYGLDRTDWPLMMTGAVIVTAPVIAIFVIAQRAFLQDGSGQGVLGR